MAPEYATSHITFEELLPIPQSGGGGGGGGHRAEKVSTHAVKLLSISWQYLYALLVSVMAPRLSANLDIQQL